MEIDERKLMNWLDKFGVSYEYETDRRDIKIFKRAHISGHASQPELQELIRKIKPKVLIPIHTENPELFEKICKDLQMGTKVILPEYGKKYTFD
jgi:ribonuclease J